MTQFDALGPNFSRQKFESLKIQDGCCRYFEKIENSPYTNPLTDYHKIWYTDASVWSSLLS